MNPVTKSELKASQDFLNQIKIATPCSADWGEMTGDERVKFCGLCRKNVYNLSSMTAQAARDLIKEKEGKLCVSFFRRYDGTVLTSDCPIGLGDRALRLWWKGTALVASFIASIYFVGCKKKVVHQAEAGGMVFTEPIMGDVANVPTKGEYSSSPILGRVACPPVKKGDGESAK